jgi:N-acetylmuramoyl-L-alanine amidase
MNMICLRLLAVFLSGLLTACGNLPLQSRLPVEERPSLNFGERRPGVVILHHTTNDDAETALRTLTHPLKEVSAHYLIGRDGKIYYLVDEAKRAWHAGDSFWGGIRDLNSVSIGIELDNNGREAFPEIQIEALIALLDDVVTRWKIPRSNILGHGDVAPGRKVDPSALFPWQRLARAGLGLWCEPPFAPVAPEVDDALLLAALGYDITRLDAAMAAFRRHWVPAAVDTPSLSPEQRALAQCLAVRKAEVR